jgi:hypothetical protein
MDAHSIATGKQNELRIGLSGPSASEIQDIMDADVMSEGSLETTLRKPAEPRSNEYITAYASIGS